MMLKTSNMRHRQASKGTLGDHRQDEEREHLLHPFARDTRAIARLVADQDQRAKLAKSRSEEQNQNVRRHVVLTRQQAHSKDRLYVPSHGSNASEKDHADLEEYGQGFA